MSDTDLLIRLEEVEARVSSADEKITELVTRLEALEKANDEIIQRLESLESQSQSQQPSSSGGTIHMRMSPQRDSSRYVWIRFNPQLYSMD